MSCSSSKTPTQTATAIKAAIDSSSWLFTATNVIPQGSSSRQPNGVYTMRLTPTELNVYLPYFGRAYGGAGVYGADNPMNFESTEFDKQQQRMKDDKWRISFKPAKQQIESMVLEVFDNGAANLDVMLTNRTPISYRGVIRPLNSSGR